MKAKNLLCVYCGEHLLYQTSDEGLDRNVLEHFKVHKVLRHKKLPVKYYGRLFSAVKDCQTTLKVLKNI